MCTDFLHNFLEYPTTFTTQRALMIFSFNEFSIGSISLCSIFTSVTQRSLANKIAPEKGNSQNIPPVHFLYVYMGNFLSNFPSHVQKLKIRLQERILVAGWVAKANKFVL